MKMVKFLFNKLIRDHHFERLVQRGSVFHTKPLDDHAFDQALRDKLLEEAHEVVVSGSKDELIAEIADVLEVLQALQELHGILPDEVKVIQEQKRADRGGFDKRIYVAVAEHQEGSSSEAYCRAQPDKYPEIKDESA